LVGLALALWVVVAVGLPTSGAWAHSGLVSVTPADGSTISKAPTSVELVFNEHVNPDYVTVVLTSSGTPVTLGTPVVVGPKVTASVTGATAPGSYRIAYRVVSVDGHPVSGETTFSIAGATTASSQTPASTTSVNPSATTPSATAGQPSTSHDTEANHVPALVALGIFVVGGGLLGWREVRRRQRTH